MKREPLLVVGLMVLAGIRVAIFATLLPAVTRPDELQHYDRILAVAKGQHFGGVKPLSDEAIGTFFLALQEDSKSAATAAPETSRSERRPAPPASESTSDQPLVLALNHEDCEPPLYYEMAAAWHQLGEVLVWRHMQLPYWDRYLNILFVAGLVGLGYLVGRRVFSGSARLIVPTLLAFLPQSDLYGLNNDSLLPLIFGFFVLAYVGLLAQPTSVWRSFVCGLALALCAWTKTTCVPVLVLGTLAFAQTLLTREAVARKVGGFVAGLAVAIPLYVLNLRTFGHLSGAFTKMQLHGYTLKPFAQWFHHPFFTPVGFIEFCTELSNSYWLGEMSFNPWQGEVLLHAPYLFVWVCPLLTLLILAVGWRATPGVDRRVLVFSWICVMASAGFLAASSIPLTYGIRPTPTPWWTFPGFVGGRLMIGTLIPFAVLTASACERLKSPRIRIALLLGALLALNVASAWLLADAFTGRFSVSSILR